MKRHLLISQVKEQYAGIAAHESQQHFHQTSTEMTSDAYYERLTEAVVAEIENGRFDSCRSGAEIINKVAADKSLLPGWNEQNQ